MSDSIIENTYEQAEERKIMTPKERAEKAIAEVIAFDDQIGDITKIDNLHDQQWHAFHYDPASFIEKLLREQIEECAKIADMSKEQEYASVNKTWDANEPGISNGHCVGADVAEGIAAQIRALAENPPALPLT